MLLCSIALSDLRLATIAPMHPGLLHVSHNLGQHSKLVVAGGAHTALDLGEHVIRVGGRLGHRSGLLGLGLFHLHLLSLYLYHWHRNGPLPELLPLLQQ